MTTFTETDLDLLTALARRVGEDLDRIRAGACRHCGAAGHLAGEVRA